MQVLKKDKDGTAVADRPIFILETEETMLGILVKYFLVPEAGCLQLYYQVEEEPTLYKAEESIPKAPFLDKKQVVALFRKKFESLRLFNGIPKFVSGGYLKETDFKAIILEITRVLAENNALAKSIKTPLLRYLEAQGLQPKPSGLDAHAWLAACPFSNKKHFMMVSSKTNTYGCGWCKKKGGQASLVAYFEGRG